MQVLTFPKICLVVFVILVLALLCGRCSPDRDSSSQVATESVSSDAILYDVSGWQMGRATLDPKELLTLLGSSATTTDALDFYGNTATKYRYTAEHEPPLYAIDSQALLEIAWYFAPPTDTDVDKAISQNHAKKAYQLITATLAEDGKTLMTELLTDQTITLPKTVVHAQCLPTLCQIVLKKPSGADNTSQSPLDAP